MHYRFWLLLSVLFVVIGCSPYRHINRSAQQTVIQSKALQMAHVGICIYEPATGKYWYNYQEDKFFIPASNTKIPTTYAAMKYLGDSLPGLRYEENNGSINIVGTGDPTFLHPDCKSQPVLAFLKKASAVNYLLDDYRRAFTPLGTGWAWDDYLSNYAPERSEMPMYGNVARFFIQGDTLTVIPKAFYNDSFQWKNEILRKGEGPWFEIVRSLEQNRFRTLHSPSMYKAKTKFTVQLVPFKTTPDHTSPFARPTLLLLLEDTLHQKIGTWSYMHSKPILQGVIYSQPTDSMLKPLMHRSDNFFAEQTLLMVSNQVLGFMSDAKIIDTLLKTDLKDLPQTPRLVDGSGLSRYNLFTPQSFVAILDKMKREFGMERLKEIFPAGNDGTLRNYYVSDSAFIWAKTGTLSGVVALSGYLLTKKNKLVLFSVLVNNHRASATDVRRSVEQFLIGVRERY